MFYSEDIIEQVRTENDIVEVIGDYVKLTKKGSSYFGLCPFHNEKTPSFSVSPHKQMFYCFGCGEGGNVLTFLMKYENYSFTEAMEVLASRAGIALPKATNSKEEKKKQDLKNKIIEINTEAAKYFYHVLMSDSGKRARDYFATRKLDFETVTQFGLGYADKQRDDLYKYLKEKGYKDDELNETGLFTFDEKKGVNDKFFNRVMFPIMDPNNRVIAFGGRVMGDFKPKYLNSPETKVFDKSRSVYGLNIARKSRKGYFLVCEGYMDVIALHQVGFTNAVAALGTAFTNGHAQLLKRYVDEVVLTFDSDEAGTKAALRAIPYLRDAGLQIKVLNMDPYKDPDEFINAEGRDEYQKRIDAAENYFIFQVRTKMSEYRMEDPQEKTAFHKDVADMIVEFNDDIERQNYIEAVCKEFDIPKDGLEKLVRDKALTYTEGSKKTPEMKPHITKKQKKEDASLSVQRFLLAYIIDDTRILGKLREYIEPVDFTDDTYHKVAEIIWSQMDSDDFDPAAIMDSFMDEGEHRKVAALFVSPFGHEPDFEEREKTVNDAVRRIKKASLDEKAQSITDIAEMQKVIEQQKELRKINIKL